MASILLSCLVLFHCFIYRVASESHCVADVQAGEGTGNDFSAFHSESRPTVDIEVRETVNSTVCLKARFHIKELIINGTHFDIGSSCNFNGSCFRVNFSSGEVIGGKTARGWATLVTKEKTKSFLLVIELEYQSSADSVSWTWEWTSVTVQEIDSQLEPIAFDIQGDFKNWKVSLDQYFSCENTQDHINWTCHNSYIVFRCIRLSAGGLMPQSKQRQMLCTIPSSDKIVSLCLSAVFTTILIVSTAANLLWRLHKYRKSKKGEEYATLVHSHSANYETM